MPLQGKRRVVGQAVAEGSEVVELRHSHLRVVAELAEYSIPVHFCPVETKLPDIEFLHDDLP